MKKIQLLLFSFCFIATALCQSAGNDYWQQKVNYTIDVSLNDSANTLDGYIKMDYFNHSPDTLRFIWIHLWPNAYKNDKTAFSDQLLENGRTDFYFSDNDQHGYINRLAFKVNGITVKMKDHPEHQDIIQITLPQPLAPNTSCKIETPFHEKIPYNFSRGGHVGHSYQLSQWYPKPAVYDKKGWHPIPYLDQGEFYSDFGKFHVQITVPNKYVVAATGERMDSADADLHLKTLTYEQDSVHDFAWFADSKYVVEQDTLQLASGRIIKVAAYHFPSHWKNVIQYMKRSVLTRSQWLGEYPYNTVTAVEAEMGAGGGMEYPTITSIATSDGQDELEETIEHEVGHNWNYGILATNEREHAWMDEGINNFYDDRYVAENVVKKTTQKNTFVGKRMPADRRAFQLANTIAVKKDQPIETPSTIFTERNYYRIAYGKTALWLKYIETTLGRAMFDSCMHEFYNRWKFKHPYPADLKKVFEDVSGKNLDTAFSLLNQKGPIPSTTAKKDTKFASYFNFKDTDKHHYIFAAPAVGYNAYDQLMLGAVIHNYTLPAEKFQYLVSPLYGTGSKQLNGIGRISYTAYPKNNGKKIEVSLAAMSFSDNSFTDSTGYEKHLRFSKIVPSIKIVFANKNARSPITKFLQWKTFFISPQGLLFTRDTVLNADIITYPTTNTYINQLRFVIENKRVLYPYKGELKVEQSNDFVRAAFTGNYYFNYVKDGGMKVRLFAGKFFYLGDNTYLKQFETDPYHLNMSGAKGYEDYTYEDYFVGRNKFEKMPSQQIMERDGFFKVRTDLLSSKIGKTDKWLAALNLTTDVPKKINPLQMLPIKIPLKAFFDIGTYADAWQKNASTGRFIYDAGLQLSLFKNTINIYVPILYSKVYSDYFKSTITEKRFWKNLSFSIDIHNITVKKVLPQLPL